MSKDSGRRTLEAKQARSAREMPVPQHSDLNLLGVVIGKASNKVCSNCRWVHDVISRTEKSLCLLGLRRLVRHSPIL